VLDVGCGTGRLAAALAERALARVWAVDAEPEMVEVARGQVPVGVGVREGRAEMLPFKDGWFDRVVLWLAVHLVDRGAAFGEAARVLAEGGRLGLVTFHPDHFSTSWLAPLFPSLEAIDRARFPTPEDLEVELPAAGFGKPRFVRVTQKRMATRAAALERLRAGHISTFDLLSRGEIDAGIARAERELPETVEITLDWLLVVAALPTAVRPLR
jgi:SAM-dependent methyltransferase